MSDPYRYPDDAEILTGDGTSVPNGIITFVSEEARSVTKATPDQRQSPLDASAHLEPSDQPGAAGAGQPPVLAPNLSMRQGRMPPNPSPPETGWMLPDDEPFYPSNDFLDPE